MGIIQRGNNPVTLRLHLAVKTQTVVTMTKTSTKLAVQQLKPSDVGPFKCSLLTFHAF